ncbi:MAG: 6,7-dimethyl-8-ribityllumazine synthase [Cellvibrionales bacterium]|nr:6,7-dimethyl-8-ribityllumazine synthase [Cellvibrionales bacterium]|tara:strand:+ start:438 stop:977 length:540 start_codon:yes stop_codon:yes gene_type:complete
MKTEAEDPRSKSYQRSPELQEKIDRLNCVSGDFEAQSYRVAIIIGRWHAFIADNLLAGALETLDAVGITEQQIDIFYVPGAYEIPLAAKRVAQLAQYKAAVTLGAVIKGDTPHFDFVAGECARGIADVSLEYDLPIGFGVLTVNTVDQALARAEQGEANKGREATLAALEMADLLSKLT